MGYSHGKKWTDELIKSEVLKINKTYKLNRMPTRKECTKLTNSEALSNAITRREGGWYQLARELNLPIKKSETTLGKEYEENIANILRNKGYEVIKMSQNFPYDLLINSCLKIDVKVSHLYKGDIGNFYSFRTGKKYATCDIYILVTIDDNGNILNIYVIPSVAIIKNAQISIGEHNSIYDQYKNKFEYIKEYCDFFIKQIKAL